MVSIVFVTRCNILQIHKPMFRDERTWCKRSRTRHLLLECGLQFKLATVQNYPFVTGVAILDDISRDQQAQSI